MPNGPNIPLTESSLLYPSAVRRIDTADDVLGGKPENLDATVNSAINYALQALANRTAYLKKQLDAISIAAIASETEAEAGTNNTKMMTPLRTKQAIDEFADSPPIASETEAEAGTNNTKMMTPLRTKQAIDEFADSPPIASETEAEAGTNNTKMMTPLRTKQAIDEFADSPPIASETEAEAGTNNTKMMTPLRTKQAIDEFVPDASLIQKGVSEFATNSETLTGTAIDKSVTPNSLFDSTNTFLEIADNTVQGGSYSVTYVGNYRRCLDFKFVRFHVTNLSPSGTYNGSFVVRPISGWQFVNVSPFTDSNNDDNKAYEVNLTSNKITITLTGFTISFGGNTNFNYFENFSALLVRVS